VDENLMSEISICIPTYEFYGDGVKYLSELFDTIECQTFTDYDIVISDHSKDDEIYNFCEQNSEKFEITYVRNENGRGYQAPNTNCCLEFAEGKILKVIYQDDLFVDPFALQKIKDTFDKTQCKWMMHGFNHTPDGKSFNRPMIPRWTDMMLEGRNLLGSPSCFVTLNECKLYMDETIRLLIDTDLYHRMRMSHGMPHILEDVLASNREHPDRVSSNRVTYDMQIDHPEGGWLVNRYEYEYVTEKHKNNREYPDEN
jgi:glycosyltransferase involved in cell wall biosynthesis